MPRPVSNPRRTATRKRKSNARWNRWLLCAWPWREPQRTSAGTLGSRPCTAPSLSQAVRNCEPSSVNPPPSQTIRSARVTCEIPRPARLLASGPCRVVSWGLRPKTQDSRRETGRWPALKSPARKRETPTDAGVQPARLVCADSRYAGRWAVQVETSAMDRRNFNGTAFRG
jgi:hypothetical protein